MILLSPCDEPLSCPGSNCSMPIARFPRRASSKRAALPIAPNPITATSYVAIDRPHNIDIIGRHIPKREIARQCDPSPTAGMVSAWPPRRAWEISSFSPGDGRLLEPFRLGGGSRGLHREERHEPWFSIH